MIIRMNPEVSLSLEEMFLKNNKALKMLFKLIKRNLLCTLLYKKDAHYARLLIGKNNIGLVIPVHLLSLKRSQ